jgi:hypothetical protein
MARPKRRQVQVGDTIILRNQCIPDHPTLPVWIGGQQTVIPAGLRGQVVEVWLWGAAPKLIVDLGGGVHADCSHGAVGGWVDEAG